MKDTAADSRDHLPVVGSSSFMAVPVVDVRVVWVTMRQRFVIMGVRMRLPRGVVRAVRVLMMLVVPVPMSV
jgi:hypothetical protein